jgi:hypothetical protein
LYHGPQGAYVVGNTANITNGKVTIQWNGSYAPAYVSLNYYVEFKYTKSDGTEGSGTHSSNLNITLKGIPSNADFNAPKLSVQSCCEDVVRYSMTGYAYADEFIWTVPQGWQIIGSSSGSFIDVKPSSSGGGVIKCRMQLKCSQPTYFKEKQITVSRHNPSAALVASTVRYSNQFGDICPMSTYTYSIAANSQVCGATYFTWNFPQSWQVNTGQVGDPNPPVAHNFWVSAQNTSQVTIQTSQNPANGTISVTAHFNSCSSVTASLNAYILTDPPSAITFVNEDYEFYHCNKWKMCSTGGQIPVEIPLVPNQTTENFVDYFTFSIDPPRYFTSPQGAVQQKVVAFGQQDFGRTPLIQGTGGPTQLLVTATNCIGTSAASSITISDEDPAWCPGIPYSQPYPIGCECCEPGEDPNPKKTDKEQAQFKLTPNPTQGFLTFNLPKIAPAQISIYTTEGKLIEQFTLIGGDTEYQLDSKINAGIYIVHIIQADASAIEKLIVLK